MYDSAKNNGINICKWINLGIIYSYKCNIRCKHCIVSAAPERLEKISVKHAKDIIKQASKIGIKRVSISGGEPFLFYEELLELINFASSLGIFLSICTNAYWAKTKTAALKTVAPLAKAGLKKLLISTDIFHTEFIELGKIVYAVASSQRNGIECKVRISYDPEGKILNYLINNISKPSIFSSGIFPGGRALELYRNLSLHKNKNLPINFCLFDFYRPVLLPSDNLIACCKSAISFSHPNSLILGNLKSESLERIFGNIGSNILWKILRINGPRWLYSLANKEQFIDNRFHHIKDRCELCYKLLDEGGSRIYSFLNDNLRKNKELRREMAVCEIILAKKLFSSRKSRELQKINNKLDGA